MNQMSGILKGEGQAAANAAFSFFEKMEGREPSTY
jgi:hypothetical protein